MGLDRLKRVLNKDQRNSMTAVVVSDGSSAAMVRTPTGEVFSAIKQSTDTLQAGTLVQVRRTGRIVQILGTAPLAELDGAAVYVV